MLEYKAWLGSEEEVGGSVLSPSPATGPGTSVFPAGKIRTHHPELWKQ